MPVPIKIIFSLVVLGVAVAGYFFLDWLGQGETITIEGCLCLKYNKCDLI